MRRLAALGLMLALAATPLPAWAQTTASGGGATAAPALDPTALGVSTDRIKRRLAADSQARSTGSSPLKLEYRVDVFGTAPALRFFRGQDLVFGAVPGSAPTHADMLYMMTPQEFRAPTADFLSLLIGAAGAGKKKVQDWRYLRDLRNYQKLVEQGINVPAPEPPKK